VALSWAGPSGADTGRLAYLHAGDGRDSAALPLLVILAISILAGASFAQRAHAAAWLDSGNPTKIAVGRLISGIQNVRTGGEEGSNSRFQSTTVVIAAARDYGFIRFRPPS
jgi:hypothetical protein